MMSTRDADRSPQEPPAGFHIVTVPIGEYAKHSSLPADAEAAKVVALLEQIGGVETEHQASAALWDLRRVNLYLSRWADYSEPSSRLLYWASHGEANPDGAWLAVHDTDSPMRGSAVGPEALADHIANQWARRRNDSTWAMVVIEACGAERFVSLLNAHLGQRFDAPKRLILFAAGGQGESYLGTFAHALQKALAGYTDNDTEIRLLDLIQRVRGYCLQAYCLPIDVFPEPSFRRRQVLPGGITATVDVYEELQRFLGQLPADERGHFVPKAQGAEQGELAWYFTGRTQERAQICKWLRTEDRGMLVVTGRAGSGKSALLGNVLVYSNPELRNLLVRHRLVDELPDSELPPDNAFTEVVHLTGMTTAELVRRLLDSLGASFGTTLNESLEALIALLQDRDQSYTLLVDALDEAQEPTSIAASVLRRIAAQSRCRVVVGTRKSTREGPDQPDTQDDNLLSALGENVEADTRVLEVKRDAAAMHEYAMRRFASAKASVSTGLPLAYIADRICAQPARQFLYARLAVHEILAEPELLQYGNRARLEALLEHDHQRLFAVAVARLKKLTPINEALIVALAYTGGRGLPRSSGIWAIVAQAVADEPCGPVTDEAIDNLLQAAAPYIILDGEEGQTVYRLAHRTFQEYFSVSAAAGERAVVWRQRHGRIAQALLDTAGAGQPSLNPYLKSHLARHVGISGSWFTLVDYTDVLDRLDPGSVAAALLTHAFGWADVVVPPEITVVASARYQLEALGPEERALTHVVAMARLSDLPVRREDVGLPADGTPRLAWAKLDRIQMHIVLAGHSRIVKSLAALTLPDGRYLLASGAQDNTIRLWDAGTGAAIGAPLVGHTDSVTSLVAIMLGDEQCLLASGSSDQTVRLWDPATGHAVGAPLRGHTMPVTSLVAVKLAGGQSLLASGSMDKTIRLWDPVTQRQVGGPLIYKEPTNGDEPTNRDGPTNRDVSRIKKDGGITSLAAFTFTDGRSVVASGSDDGSIRLWDPVSRQQIRSLPSWYDDVGSLAAFSRDGRHLLGAIVRASRDYVHLWDAYTGETVKGFSCGVPSTALAALKLADGRLLLALAGRDKAIRLFDAATGYLVGVLLAGHTSDVTSLAVLALADGRCLLASGSVDRTVRLWDPAAAADAVPSKLAGKPFNVVALAALASINRRCLFAAVEESGTIVLYDSVAGRAVEELNYGDRRSRARALTFESDRYLLFDGDQLWNPTARKMVGMRFDKYTGLVSLASATLADGRCLFFSGWRDGTVHLWEMVANGSFHAPVIIGNHNGSTSLAVLKLADGRHLLASGGSDRTIRLWDLIERKALGEPSRGHDDITSLAPLTLTDGRCLFACGSREGTVRLWDPNGGDGRSEPLVDGGAKVTALLAITLKDRRRLLASASEDGTMRLWDIAASTRPFAWNVAFEPCALAWSDGKLIVGGDAGMVAFELEPPAELPAVPGEP